MNYSYIEKIGVEVEGYLKFEQLPSPVSGGEWSEEAGKDTVELIISPQDSVESNILILREMLKMTDGSILLEPFRGGRFIRNQGVWNGSPRYDALRSSLAIEKPGYENAVAAMTNSCAAHMSFSGENIFTFGASGIFLINLFNNIAPFLAVRAHKVSGLGVGHLSIWQDFAFIERFPDPGRWFESSEAMILHIESLPKLFKMVGEDCPLARDENMYIKEWLDLTFLWWLLRPKVGPWGAYLELRHLPAMPLGHVEHFFSEAVSIINLALEWFYHKNFGKVVGSVEDSVPAFEFLAENLPFSFPEEPLSKEVWQDLVNNH